MAKLEISTVESQQNIKSLKDEVRILFRHMQDLNKVFNKHIALAQSLSGMLTGQLEPAERKVAAIAKRAESALIKQARATNAAREKTLNFTQALKLSGATQQQQKFILRGVTQSLTTYRKTMSSGVVTARQFQTAQDRLNKSLGGAKRSLAVITSRQKKHEKSAKGAAQASKGFGNQLRNIGSSAVFAVGPLSGIGARVVAFSAIASRTSVKVAALTLSIIALGVGLGKLITFSLRATLEMQKIESALTVATGSAAGARDAFEFVKDVSIDLGLSLKDAAGQFGQLSAAAKGTALEGAGIRKVFLGASKAIVALSLSTEQATGVFRALQQMISKGTVQAEELRGQLGERLPGAFQIAAIAMGVTTRELGKMLELGKVLAEDLLPKLGEEFEKRFAKQAAIASGNLRAALNRVTTATFLFGVELDNTVKTSVLAAGALDTISSSLLRLAGNMATVIAVLGSIGIGLTVLAAPGIIKGIIKLVLWTKKLTAVVFGLGAAMAATPVGFLLNLGRIAIATGIAFLGFKQLEKSLDTTTVSQAGLIAELEEYIRVVNEAEGATQSAINAQIDLAEKGIRAIQLEMIALKKFIDFTEGTKTKQMEVITLPEVTGERDIGEIFSIPELPALEKALKSVSNFFSGLFSDGVDEAKEKVKVFQGELDALAEQIGQLKDAPIIPDLVTDKSLDKLRLQVEAMERLNEAMRAGEPARLAMVQQLDLEANIRKLGAKATGRQIALLTVLIARKHAAIAVTKALKEEEKRAAKLRKEVEAAEKKIVDLRQKAQDQLSSLEKSNDVLRLRIAGLFEEARLMEIRNALEEKYGSVLLPKTLQALIEAQQENDRLKEKLKEVNEFEQAISDGFKQMGSDIASGIREGKNLIDVLVNSFGNLLERLLDIAIQLLIIKPLLASLNLPGGAAAPSLLSMFGLGSKKGNVFQGGNVVPFRQGGVVNSPSNFGFNGGIGSIAEDGPEGILPLKRNSSGKLGVEASGMGGNTFNFYLPSGMNTREFLESGPQIEAMIAGTLSASAASNS